MDSAVDYLNSLNKFGINPGLERIKLLMEYLGNPQQEYDTIQVAGSNGKGSTSVMISSILSKAGYKVGTYNSPEIVSFYERMRINGEYMEPEALERLTSEIKPYLKRIEDQGLEHPTFFEVVTAIALKYFAEQEVEIVVLEVGLGGKLDATNVVNGLIAAITNISLEHTEYLGDTIEEVAIEKGGIIKEGSKVVTGVKDKKALAKLKEICKEREAELIEASKALKVERLDRSLAGQSFKVQSQQMVAQVQIPLLGKYQRQNLNLALAVIEALPAKYEIEWSAIEEGLKVVEWPGRLELLGEKPLIILDGAHNSAGIRELRKVIEEDLDYQSLILVLSILGDKDVEEMLEIITPIADQIIITQNTNERVAAPEQVAKLLAAKGIEVQVIPEVEAAVKEALKLAAAEDLVSISGSLYTVAEARKFLVKDIINQK
ncbi:bifunctional folylpolyglutamate synthase/dihydrofolate synthase [Fuchsiella alkaliacetigena]|uniref:bifunctional folylpolyglutamate synthase/dihydrofolate synthase n=1 Tax=Fuchsiella alkaliacetigena TaxID=957042 RepID=UPI00200B8968|nr:folylpolyglutamate synthase/dihydrofolate synthase family protein [Fuchsiella alkaliacetigena]MCK8824429.1 bifunctional folylpolyglutamate synthase/dihydrofolate synthase [Fuchsiella alkaliacetigena]